MFSARTRQEAAGRLPYPSPLYNLPIIQIGPLDRRSSGSLVCVAGRPTYGYWVTIRDQLGVQKPYPDWTYGAGGQDESDFNVSVQHCLHHRGLGVATSYMLVG